MCGIAGICGESVCVDDLLAMSHSLRHRGPNGNGMALYGKENGLQVQQGSSVPVMQTPVSAGLIHRRLSVLDMSELSAEPMQSTDANLCLSYNGEIYNYRALRAELEQLGYVFQTTGDAEVLLNAYLAWGIECTTHFEGMWAFAILDIPLRRMVLSRDRFGIKPLYYTLSNGHTYFASEIKALLAVLPVPAPNKKIITAFLEKGLVDTTCETCFEGIFSLPPAHTACISLDDQTRSLERYWSLNQEEMTIADADAVQECQKLLIESVAAHLQSERTVGSCLSGGIDSSSIHILAAKNAPDAFGYCSSDAATNEERYMTSAVQVSGGVLHKVQPDDAEIDQAINTLVAIQDEPFGSLGILAQWSVFREAAVSGITVMLDGQGADEIFAGYPRYVHETGSLGARLSADISTNTLPALLRYEDRNSMAHGIEARVPYLDTRLVEWAMRVPAHLKIRGNTPKYILRESMRGIVPDEILDRTDKIGFRADPQWTLDYARRHKEALCTAISALEEEFIDAATLSERIDRGFSNVTEEYTAWRMISVILWIRHWYRG